MDTNPLVEDNLRLVYYLYNKLGKSDFVLRYKDDLISEGFLGLTKAAKSYDPSKTKFATYASRCVMNQFLMFIRRGKREEREVSLEYPLNIDCDGNELILADVIEDEDFSLDSYIDEIDLEVKWTRFIGRLSERDRKILDLRCEGLTQRAIALELEISQSYISRLIKKMKASYKKAV